MDHIYHDSSFILQLYVLKKSILFYCIADVLSGSDTMIPLWLPTAKL